MSGPRRDGEPGAGDSSTSPVDELRGALEVVDALVSLRLEERRGGPGHRAPPAADGEGLPPRRRFGRVGPLAEVIAGAGLSDAEAAVLVAALAPHVDERFAVRYAALCDRPGVRGLTGEVARTLASRTFRGRLDATLAVSPQGRLRSAGLLVADQPPDGGTELEAVLRPEPALLAFLLGMPPPPQAATADFPARALTTVHTLEDVVLPGAVRGRLGELRDRIVQRDVVVEDWGFATHHDNVTGLVALLHGPPGTGKTMTAAALAVSAGLPAYIVDLSALVSKYIGETEKALARVFDRAARERCLLVFDEADAVFGARTEVGDAHDRYANQEVSYLLARIEQHPGAVVLTTNLLGNIDPAFQRRIHVLVEFPAPGLAERQRLWKVVAPRQLPMAADIDLAALAARYPLTGAQIRDATLEAAYLAAANGGVVGEEYLVTGIKRQLEKAGKAVPR